MSLNIDTKDNAIEAFNTIFEKHWLDPHRSWTKTAEVVAGGPIAAFGEFCKLFGFKPILQLIPLDPTDTNIIDWPKLEYAFGRSLLAPGPIIIATSSTGDAAPRLAKLSAIRLRLLPYSDSNEINISIVGRFSYNRVTSPSWRGTKRKVVANTIGRTIANISMKWNSETSDRFTLSSPSQTTTYHPVGWMM